MKIIFILFSALAIIGNIGLLYCGYRPFLFPFNVILVNLFLGFRVLLQNPRGKMNISFNLITFSMAVWTVGVYLFWNSRDAAMLFIGGKIAFASAGLIPSFALLFSLVYPKEEKPISVFQWGVILLPLFLLPHLIFSNSLLKDVWLVNGVLHRTYGPAYPVFCIYVLLYMGMCFYNLFAKFRRLSGIVRLQARYLIFGFGLLTIVSLTTNLILPFFGIGAFSFIGPHASLFLIIFVAYAIIRYRLMDISVIISRTTAYLIITAIYALSYVFITLAYIQLFSFSFNPITVVYHILFFIIGAWLFVPLRLHIQTTADRVILRGKYGYCQALSKLSNRITRSVDLPDIFKTLHEVCDVMEASNPKIYLSEEVVKNKPSDRFIAVIPLPTPSP